MDSRPPKVLSERPLDSRSSLACQCGRWRRRSSEERGWQAKGENHWSCFFAFIVWGEGRRAGLARVTGVSPVCPAALGMLSSVHLARSLVMFLSPQKASQTNASG